MEYKGKKYAAKKYRHAEQAKLFSVFVRQLEILAVIKHPNIVPYIGIGQLDGDGSSVIVMEKLDMNLATYVEDRDNFNLPLVRKFQVLSHIAQGLHHLHSQRPAIIHRDLTATNVLLDSRGVAKLGDFGNSRMVDFNVTPEIMTSNPGTLDYMPPEALEGGVYNQKLDIFSFGHLAIYTIIQHRPHPLQRPTYKKYGKLIPRTEVERRQVYIEEVTAKLGIKEQPFLPVIVGCLHAEPDHRPSCPDILGVLGAHATIYDETAPPAGDGRQSELTPTDNLKVMYESLKKPEEENPLINNPKSPEGIYCTWNFIANDYLHMPAW